MWVSCYISEPFKVKVLQPVATSILHSYKNPSSPGFDIHLACCCIDLTKPTHFHAYELTGALWPPEDGGRLCSEVSGVLSSLEC